MGFYQSRFSIIRQPNFNILIFVSFIVAIAIRAEYHMTVECRFTLLITVAAAAASILFLEAVWCYVMISC